MDRAILICAFGAPKKEEEIEGFLQELMGKPPPAILLKEVLNKYRFIGSSPLFQTLTSLRERIARGLKREVFLAFLYGRPSVEEVADQMLKGGVRDLLALYLSPYRSPYTTEVFERKMKALEREGMRVRVPPLWFDHPQFLDLWARRIKGKLKEREPLLFSAHAIPEEGSGRSPYLSDIMATARGIVERTKPCRWKVAFQSRGRGGRWIGPDIKEAILSFKEEREVLICPIGFLFDHLETLYDLDQELRGWAEGEGIRVERIECLNASEDFVQFLLRLLKEG